MKELIKQLLAKITGLQRELIVSIANDHLGIDASPDDLVDDVVGCVESVTNILVKAGVWDKIEVGTWTFNQNLQRSRRWRPTQVPREGDIIISPTGTGNGSIRGHVGIVGKRGIIYSNDSYTGKWMTHYTIDTWTNRYKNIGGFPIYYYRYI